MSLLSNRKADNRSARLRELMANPSALTREQVEAVIDRAFEAGVAAKSDHDFAQRLERADRPVCLEITNGVKFMPLVRPGNLVLMTR